MADLECFEDDLGKDCLLRMVKIPAGQFVMGSPPDEAQRQENEGPCRPVTLNEFYLGCYPVTQQQWQAIAALEAVGIELPANPSHFQGLHHPVEQVSWDEAVEFCQRLSRVTQRQYRLPSEAEWEYACRAGSQTPFHCGSTLTADAANYDSNHVYGEGDSTPSSQATTPVGEGFAANAWGIHHLHGNVREWCDDHWHDSYEGAPSDGRPWTTSEAASPTYVRRGGSWNSYPWYCRSAARYHYPPSYRSNYLGFRLVCEG